MNGTALAANQREAAIVRTSATSASLPTWRSLP